jgi:hypothetical protein
LVGVLIDGGTFGASGKQSGAAHEGGIAMRKLVLKAMIALPLALAVSTSARAEEQRTVTTTTYSGTVSEVSPSSSTIVLKSESSPQTVEYVYNDKTEWLDAAGNRVTVEKVRHQPVTIYYKQDGDQMVVTRVVTQKPKVIEKETTTTRTMEAE